MRRLILLTALVALMSVPTGMGRDFSNSAIRPLSVAASPLTTVPAAVVSQDALSPEQQLADRYAPVVYLRNANDDLCDTDNEGFDPAAIDLVLGNDDMDLAMSESGDPSDGWTVVKEGPTANDLHGLDQSYFIDSPGSPLDTQCVYRQYFAERRESIPNVAYAHIFQEPGTDILALQYWMYYYLNDWNNTHEGDWEMIMLFFDADSVEKALELKPQQVVYAQHGGGEKADWDDLKLNREDGHPVVYVARGAHASQYEPKVYLGLAENGTGFGCETAKGPHRRVALEAVVVPHEPSGPDDPFAWLSFTGRWGELQASEWNGPTGPNTKPSWNEPVTWAEGVRETSLTVPEFGGFGQAPVNLFCGVVGAGSVLLTAFGAAPALTLGFVGVIIAITFWTASYAVGTVRQAFRFYRANVRTFGLIGAMLLPVGFIVATAQTLLFAIPPIEPLLTMMERFPGVRIFLLLVLGSLNVAIAVVFVGPAVIVATERIHAGLRPGLAESYRQGTRLIWRIFVSRLRVTYRSLLDALTIVRIPRAIRRFTGGLFVAQAVAVHDAEPETAIDRSFEAARSSMARSLITNTVLYVIVLLTGPLIAIFLMLAVPTRPLGLINFISSLLFAFLYPVAVIGMTLLYYELRDDVGER